MILTYTGGGTTDGDGTHEPVTVGECAFQILATEIGSAQSIHVPGVGWVTVVVHSDADAEALAAARIARDGSDLLAADCRPVAHAVADALVAAGLGS